MYIPPIHTPRGASGLLRRLAERLSGRPAPAVGTESDRPMQKGVPGALTFSVGEAADPRMPGTFVLDGSGPDAALPVLQAVASRPPAPGAAEPDAAQLLLSLAALVLVFAALLGFAWAFIELVHALVGLAGQMNIHDPMDRMSP
jgi:hypothetical protein